MVGNWGEGGKFGIVCWVVDYPGFPIPMQSWNPSVMGHAACRDASPILHSPAGFVLRLDLDSRIAGLIEDCVVIVLGLWLAMGASCGLQAFLT